MSLPSRRRWVINRSRSIGFEFDGTRYEGHPGDTSPRRCLQTVCISSRGFKYHRPRGIFGAGSEAQCARSASCGARQCAPLLRTLDGLIAASQNRWPSLGFDVGAINDVLSRLLPAGFYYKTFMWPPSPHAWLRYEHIIRAAAGMGRAAMEPDPDRYEHQFAHCDVLIVGGGPAGLAAARAATAAGGRVIFCDEGSRFGGSLIGDDTTIDGEEAKRWLAATTRELVANPDVTLLARRPSRLRRGNLVGLLSVSAITSSAPPAYMPRQRLWKVRARAVVLAAGAHSGRSRTRTTICPARCSRAQAHVSSVMGCGRERARSSSRPTTAPMRRRWRCATPTSRSLPSSMPGPTRR